MIYFKFFPLFCDELSMLFMFDKYVFILDIKNIPYNALFFK